MPPTTTAPDPSAAEASAAERRSAAEHCAAAEDLFACARALHPLDGAIPAALATEYERCLSWAGLHLRLAEAITAGAGLVLTHRQLAATPGVRLHNTHVSHETHQWTEFLKGHHDTTRTTT